MATFEERMEEFREHCVVENKKAAIAYYADTYINMEQSKRDAALGHYDSHVKAYALLPTSNYFLF